MKNYKKGQVTIINLLVILMIMITFFVFLPVITQFTTSYALPAITASSMDQPTKDVLTALVQLFPIAVTVAILISALNYAIPRREG